MDRMRGVARLASFSFHGRDIWGMKVSCLGQFSALVLNGPLVVAFIKPPVRSLAKFNSPCFSGTSFISCRPPVSSKIHLHHGLTVD